MPQSTLLCTVRLACPDQELLKLTFEALGELQLFRRSVDATKVPLKWPQDVATSQTRRESRVMTVPSIVHPFINSDSHELLEGGKHGHRDRKAMTAT